MTNHINQYNPKLKKLARELRKNSTKSEVLLWQQLKAKKMAGYGFNRQKPIGNYILDFYCKELKLGIELDGYSHTIESIHEKDIEKETAMKNNDITILRFQDSEVFNDMQRVLYVIEHTIRVIEKGI